MRWNNIYPTPQGEMGNRQEILNLDSRFIIIM